MGVLSNEYQKDVNNVTICSIPRKIFDHLDWMDIYLFLIVEGTLAARARA